MTTASGCHRLAAPIAQGWRERAKVPPARVTRRRSRRRIEHGMARDAQRREQRGDKGVGSSVGATHCRHSSVVNPKPLALFPERLAADAEHLGGARLVASGLAQDEGDVLALEVLERRACDASTCRDPLG